MSIFRKQLFSGKVAIVSGAASAIGRAVTQELLNLGCKVMVSAKNESRLAETFNDLRLKKKNIKSKVCDITDEEQVKDLILTTLENFNKIDFLVNNVRCNHGSKFKNVSTSQWKRSIDINLTGQMLMCREAYINWMQRNGGAIVNVTGEVDRGRPLFAHTSAPTCAVNNLTKSLAVEWAENGIRINCVCPEGIQSRSPDRFCEDNCLFDASLLLDSPMKRAGTPEEVASCVTFLLSPGASYLTGLNLRADGGRSLHQISSYPIPEHTKSTPYTWDFHPRDSVIAKNNRLPH